jgi:hypothetical protein
MGEFVAKKTIEEESVLLSAARTIGATAGKIAALAGVESPEGRGTNEAKDSSGKFQKTGKKRLPRKEKKALKKAAKRGA